MSRIGILPISVPNSVTVESDGAIVSVTGAKGSQTITVLREVDVSTDDEQVTVRRRNDSPQAMSQQGLVRTLIANAVHGVSEGFSKTLEVVGVGYKVNVSGNQITLDVGYSHPHKVTLPEGVEASQEGNTLHITGADKQLVGQVAANIRALRPPEPYKGKGIKYADERIIRKAGKAGAGK